MSDKQKLFFTISGKKFGYDGYPANRTRDLLDFIVKRKTPEDSWVTVFRENQPPEDAGLTDSQVYEKVAQAKEARERKKAAKAAATSAEDTAASPSGEGAASPPAQTQQPAPLERVPPVNTPAASVVFTPTTTAPPPNQSPRRGSVQAGDVGEKSKRVTEAERDELRGFINQILNETEGDTGAVATSAFDAANSTNPGTTSPALGATGSAVSGGKLMVYLERGQQAASKVISVAPGTSYKDFEAAVERKFGAKMEMTFAVDEDLISLDDDDSLGWFLSMELKKFKVNCRPAGTRAAETVEDSMTAPTLAVGKVVAGAAAAGGVATNEFHGEQRTFTGHAAAVYCCMFAPSGERFATASRDKTVRVWNLDGEYKLMQGGHNGFVLSCDFSPNGEYIVSSSDDMTLKIWNSRTGEKRHTLKGHSDKVYCTKFNVSGAYVVSGSCDKTVRVWNADNGSRQATLKGHTMAVFSCAFSHLDNGKHVVSASDDRTVRIWDWRDSKETALLEGHTGTVWSCTFSHDDRLIVSASMDHEIKLWDVATRTSIRNFPGHMTPIHHAIFTPDDRYVVSCARDWTVMVWEVGTGRHIDTLSGHANTVYHVDICGDKLLSCSLDETVKLWQLNLPGVRPSK